MLDDIRHDWARYAKGASRRDIPQILLTQGLWASTEHRFGHWARTAAPSWARPLLVAVSVFTHLAIEATTGISIHPGAAIGPGLYIGHFGGVIVNRRAVLGAGCTLSQEVTIGQDVNPPFGAPTVGRGVFFGPGAKVFGGIAIGDHVAIGANAVVREDLPDRAIAAGVPARVIRVQDPSEVRVADIAS